MSVNQKDRSSYLSIVFLLLSVIFWGCSFISTKVVLQEIPPVSIAFFRQIIASAALFIWIFSTRSFVRVKPADIALMAFAGLFGIVLYFLFENTGLLHTSASNASMIVAAVPVFTLVTEALFFKMKIRRKMTGGIILSIIGVYLVISVGGRLDFSSKTFYGNMLVVGAMVVWVVYVIINKILGDRYPGIIITAFQTFTSVLLFTPFIVPEIKEWRPVSVVTLLNLVYLGVFCSACAYFFYIHAVKGLGAAVSSAFLNLIPVVTVICGYLVLDETVTPVQAAGMLLIMGSLYWMNRQETAKPEPERD